MKFFFTVAVFLLFSGCSDTERPNPMPKSSDLGAEIFRKHCVLCHGSDGKLGLNGANDLSVSTMTESDRKNQINVGKGAMPPFEKLLSPQEIEAVAHFTLSLNKQLSQ